MPLTVKIQKAFKDFCLDVEFTNTEDCLGILGASGCGKSMTLKCIAGIETPDSGRIVLNDRILFDSEQNINLTPQERRVGYLFQNYALFPTMTVAENIGISIKGSKKKRKEIVAEQIRQLKLTGLEKHYPSQLSGGQQQRVALGRIFAYNPEIILLDEPFSALDSFLKEQLFEQLRETIGTYQGDMIMVTHSRDEIYQFCKNLMIMENGSFTQMGRTKAVFNQPKTLAAARLIGCKNISPVEKLGERELYARSWGVKLFTKEIISDKIRYIAIHDYAIREGQKDDEENLQTAVIESVREEPQAVSYFLKTGNGEGGLWWKKEASAFPEGSRVNIVINKDKLFLLY